MTLSPGRTYRRSLPHIQSEKPLFVTFSTRPGLTLPPHARDIVLRHCVGFHTQSIWLYALVVMPDHVHALFSLFPDVTLPWVMFRMKGASSRAVNIALERRGPLWNLESFDRVLRRDENVEAVARYIIANPERAGLEEPYPWTWTAGFETLRSEEPD